MVEEDRVADCRHLCDRCYSAVVLDISHGIQDAPRFDRLSAEDPVRTLGRGIRHPVHDPLAPDAGIPGEPARAANLVRAPGAFPQHGNWRTLEGGAAFCELD